MTNRTNPMVEKVARAIAARRGWPYDACFDMARAAIEAMREPTPWMCGYVERILLSCGHGHEAEDFELIWRYMAEAALTEGDL